ncbi:hypothetical protein PRZ48_013211 [Zasmidium cellare]|uniref:Uncharacterized protein n=1 Tax=Zasmidium cellare TaxID=395010 RepID=A0ABR0E4B1_ZASCE|nr:hypothetical protein PRZ48_013211 [Zasmidium cellare]
MEPMSSFIGTINLFEENTPFSIVNDPSAPNFRPDPAAQQQLDAMLRARATEKAQSEDEEKEALFRVYFDTGFTNEALLSGDMDDIEGKALLQLRVTMSSQDVLDELEARHGDGAIKLNTLHRRYGKAFESAAAEENADIATMKEAFNRVSSVSKARRTGWTRHDARNRAQAASSSSAKGKKKAT